MAVIYDETQDRSEEFGWKKVSEESKPSDQEQDLWGLITVLFAVLLATISIVHGLTVGDFTWLIHQKF